MLSGVRTGKSKKKKKAKTAKNSPRVENHELGPTVQSTETRNSSSGKKEDNASVAERLKQTLASGVPFQSSNATNAQDVTAPKSYMERMVGDGAGAVAADTNAASGVLVLDAPGMAASYSKKREEDMTVAELAAKERVTGGNSMSWNEHMTRDILRVGKKRKMKPRTAAAVGDSDEEVERLKRHLPDYHQNDNSDSAKKSEKQIEKEDQRNRRRQIDRYRKQEKITSMCSWWINSSSFAKDRLLAFGKHVSLMMAPPNLSLVAGHQFYLVPLKHAPSIVDCDDHGVREEMRLFRNSLENMYARERKGIIFCETVLPSKSFWQTRVEVTPVPFAQLQDAPIYFKSAMVEQAEEFGTHTKLFETSIQKQLRSVVPKKFPYFYIDWGNISSSNNTGYAQIIESSGFPRDFGLDTLAGMMEADPVRFHLKAKFERGFEAKLVADFAVKWKPFDWTQRIHD
mmetsp:Transcript_19448/g.40042  ORF Transcript_19448/g.40042 Transcript_19448/m.40042 type:complete len:456 (+) Transcript_19448:498-1865(+)